MMHEEVDRPKLSKTDYRFEPKNKLIFIEEIPLSVDYSNFMLSLFILVTKGTYFVSCVELSDFYLFLVNAKVKLYHQQSIFGHSCYL